MQLLRSTVNGAEVVCTALEWAPQTAFTPYLLLPETGDPATCYIVPWGADQVSVAAGGKPFMYSRVTK